MRLFIFLLLAGACFLLYRHWSRQQTKAKLLAQPLSQEERETVEDAVPLVKRLPPELRLQLEGKINLFLNQVKFYGCNDFEIDDRMRLSIAAQACLLVVNTDSWYDTLRTILIYEGAFKSRNIEQEGYVITEQETVRIGESWARGPVILSWEHTEKGAQHHDGHNVVFHEFAHQIDNLSGHTDGAPLLHRNHDFADWKRVFVSAFDRHHNDVKQGRRTLIDAYGAQAIEEYFAVVVELFFERPIDLQYEEPEVYEQLSQLFKLDPMTWQ
ncbi:MAG: zinc-dependent peptidase [Rhizobiaceae bacterium]|nr:zinc-dependent peptidase [Rhizobiaceae bacterium]